MHEFDTRLVLVPARQLRQAVEISAGRQPIQRDDLVIGVFQDVFDEVMADEARPTRN